MLIASVIDIVKFTILDLVDICWHSSNIRSGTYKGVGVGSDKYPVCKKNSEAQQGLGTWQARHHMSHKAPHKTYIANVWDKIPFMATV